MALLPQGLTAEPQVVMGHIDRFHNSSLPRNYGVTGTSVAPGTHYGHSRSVFDEPLTCNRDIASRFGRRLRELRRQRNLTQLQMSKKFGIDRSYISDVERGRKSISLGLLEVISLGLRVSLSDLFRDI
jgi:DNA-binding XRE family transcriptional regulator